MNEVKKLTIKIVDGTWYALADGERWLTAQETAELIASGVPYELI